MRLLLPIFSGIRFSFFVTNKQYLPDRIDKQISLSISYLKEHQSLLILDNVETILAAEYTAIVGGAAISWLFLAQVVAKYQFLWYHEPILHS